MPFFTVFTPTFNRADTLPVVHAALMAQTFTDFEWLVLDDGSTDGTRALVDAWAANSTFAIRYVWQENQGKHAAFDHAVRVAAGTMLVPLDSDDGCVPVALERLHAHWEAIPADERPSFLGVTCLCQDEQGRVIGGGFAVPWFDSDARTVFYRQRYRGELWGAARVDVLRQHPFGPSGSNAYVPESVMWFRIARTYRCRYVNEALRIYRTTPGSLMQAARTARPAPGAVRAAQAALDDDLEYFADAPLEFLRIAANYVRFGLHSGMPLRDQRRALRPGMARLLHLLAIVPGVALSVRDRRRAR